MTVDDVGVSVENQVLPEEGGGSEDKAIVSANVNVTDARLVVTAAGDNDTDAGPDAATTNSAGESSSNDERSAREISGPENQEGDEAEDEQPVDAVGSGTDEKESTRGELKEPRSATASSYLDFSRIPASGTNSVASIFKAASAKEPTFPVKLHMILSNPEFEGRQLDALLNDRTI